MAKIDPALTKQLQEWLDTPKSERDILAGAELLLSLNRNRALYNTVIRRPDKYAEKLEYELKKFLRIRLDGMTRAQIVELEAKVLPSAQQIIATDNELPTATKAKGRRQDHDLLPDHIKALWDDNFSLYKQINLLFEELKALNNAQPCDRYDKLQLLASADAKYRSNLKKYDEYVLAPAQAAASAPIPEDAQKKTNAARKTISKYRSRLTGSADLADDVRATAIDAIQRNVNIVLECGGGFSDDTISELSTFGIKFS